MKNCKGDKVRVITGKDKGKEGVVERVYSRQNTVLVQGLNMYKRHMKKSEKFPQGGVIDIPRTLHASNVMKITSGGKETTRIGFIVEGKKKFRFEKKTGERIK